MTELWADKYRPKKIADVVGHPKAVGDILSAMDSGYNGKAIFLHGPPGIGKTSLVEAIAADKGLALIQLNASDERKAQDIEGILDSASRTHSLFHKGKLILIDEVDGISGTSDRGGIPSIIKIIKSSKFPVFVIANDPWIPKLRPLRPYSKMVKMGKVHVASIEKRLSEICEQEGVKAQEGVLKGLSRWAQGDMRSAIGDLQMASHGRTELKMADLEVLGYRERGSTVFDIMPTIFKSRRISAARKAIFEADKDADEIFWWIENNAHREIAVEKLPEAYDLLSRADVFRQRVSIQQNWRFKAFMVDLMSGISVLKGETHSPSGFVSYQAPDRIIRMGQTKIRRAQIKALCAKIGEKTHTSTRVVRRDYLPYMKIMLKKHYIEGLDLEKEDVELIKGS